MQHKGTVTIETKRLLLRRFKAEDAPAMLNNWASEDSVTRFLTWPTHTSIEVSRFVAKDWASHYEEENYYQWAIVLKEIDEAIGSIAVIHIDEAADKTAIGYCIGSRWWSRGIMTEAFSAVIKFLFEEVGVNRIEAMHDIDNPASGKVMQKCGLLYEGTLRKYAVNNQGIVDTAMYGILAEDYFKGR